MSSINKILPIRINMEVEEILLDKIRSKMTAGISLYVSTLRWIEKRYGPEVIEEVHQFQLQRSIKLCQEMRSKSPDNSLDNFCEQMENSCAGTHEWDKIINEKNKKKYRFTRCMLAEIFRSLNAEDIGFWICEADGPGAAAFNPDIKLKRTMTIMEGYNCCDHEFYIESGIIE